MIRKAIHMRRFLFAIPFVLAAFPAHADTETLTVSAYSGSYEILIRARVLPGFERAHGVHIGYVASNSIDTLARLRAHPGQPDVDVAMVDDSAIYQAKAEGLCAKLDHGPVYGQIYDMAKLGDDAVATGVVATGIAYNVPGFEKLGWDPPASWAELGDPKYQGRLSMPGIDSIYGLQSLVTFARLNGGGIDAIDPGFTFMADKIAPNVLSFESDPAVLTAQFRSGKVLVAVWGSGRVNALADTGFPVKFVYPKEGAAALFSAACVVKGAANAAMAQMFVDYLLSADVQLALAEAGNGPVNKTVKLPPILAHRVPFGPDEVGALVTFDWGRIDPQRDAWAKRWTKDIVR